VNINKLFSIQFMIYLIVILINCYTYLIELIIKNYLKMKDVEMHEEKMKITYV
jgi:hypothetical protein